MISLIKAGAFDEIEHDLSSRIEIMIYYLSKVSNPKTKLNLQNWSGLVSHEIVPADLELQIRVFNFTKYLKANCKEKNCFRLDESCMTFLERFLPDILNYVKTYDNKFYIDQKLWDKFYQSLMDKAREWLKDNQNDVLKQYNDALFIESWNKYALGTISAWEMEALCFYHGDHELKYVNYNKYNLVNFSDLVSNEVDYYFKRNGHQIPIYKLNRIVGTVLSKNDNRHMISLLATDGVVSVKFSRDQYAKYKKQISQIQSDGTKKVIEKSWFKRGTLLMLTGYRREEDQFVVKTYANTPTHSIYKITNVVGPDIILQHERAKGNEEEEDYEE